MHDRKNIHIKKMFAILSKHFIRCILFTIGFFLKVVFFGENHLCLSSRVDKDVAFETFFKETRVFRLAFVKAITERQHFVAELRLQ